jgi:D-alanine transaminase
MTSCYLNGEFLPVAEAQISVLDRGFLFGDGVYEVIPVYRSKMFHFAEHIVRLDRSLKAIRIENPLQAVAWRAICEELIQRNGGGERSIYLQITRGVAKRDHRFPVGAKPTVFAMCEARDPPAYQGLPEVSAITCEDVRWKLCEIKAITLLPNVLLRQQAADVGASEAILIRDDVVTEGTASNVFVVSDGVVVTPPKGPHLLPGITRDLILELLHENGIPAHESEVPATALRSADEIWLSGSLREISLVTELNGTAVGSGKAGPLGQRIYELFEAHKARFIAANAHEA